MQLLDKDRLTLINVVLWSVRAFPSIWITIWEILNLRCRRVNYNFANHNKRGSIQWDP